VRGEPRPVALDVGDDDDRSIRGDRKTVHHDAERSRRLVVDAIKRSPVVCEPAS
jgi:hypothetical protein